jgi:acetyltransferase-like isoleucine patch superfamily enzyme
MKLLVSLIRIGASPVIWLTVMILRLVVRGIPVLFGELLRYTPKHSALHCWLLDFASMIAHGWGSSMRADWYRTCLGSLGADPTILPYVKIANPEHVEIGDQIAINHFTMIVAFGKITIGDGVLIGPYVLIHSGNHRFSDPDVRIRDQGHDQAPIDIEDDVWIGAHAVILKGTRVGKGSVVAAGAVVTKDVMPYSIVAGIPAKKIGDRR